MTTTQTLDAFIARGNGVLDTLEQLIGDESAGTLVAGDNALPGQILPVFRVDDDEWVLDFNTADMNGIYGGSYKLLLSTSCATVTVVSSTGHTNPTDGSAPARYKACNASAFTDLTAIGDLDGKQVVEIEIASQTAFELKLTLYTSWEHTFVFNTTNGWQGWDNGAHINGFLTSTHLEGVTVASWGKRARVQRTMVLDANTEITRIEADVHRTAPSNFAFMVQLQGEPMETANFGGDYTKSRNFTGLTNGTFSFNILLDTQYSTPYIYELRVFGKGLNPFI